MKIFRYFAYTLFLVLTGLCMLVGIITFTAGEGMGSGIVAGACFAFAVISFIIFLDISGLDYRISRWIEKYW